GAMADVEDAARYPEVSRGTFYQLAAASALAAAASRRDGALAEGRREAAAGRCAARAVQLLCRARDPGHFNKTANIARFLKDRRFAAVRRRDDYRALAAMLTPRNATTP